MFPYAHCLWKTIFCPQNGLKVKISIFSFFVTFLCVYLSALARAARTEIQIASCLRALGSKLSTKHFDTNFNNFR